MPKVVSPTKVLSPKGEDLSRRQVVKDMLPAGGMLLLGRIFGAQATAGLLIGGLSGCGEAGDSTSSLAEENDDYVTLYDTNAMALYMDGGMGPQTGIIRVDYVIANQTMNFEFWHGHGGKNHKFTVTPEHFAQLRRLERVYIETTVVADHKHKLFIDPVDARYRVRGAQPVRVPKNPLGHSPA